MVLSNRDFETLHDRIFPIAWAWFGSAIGADLLIYATMVVHLSRVPERKSLSLWWEVLYQGAQANALTLLMHIGGIALLKTSGADLWWLISVFTVSKTSTFSLLSVLNSRAPGQVSWDHVDESKRTSANAARLVTIHVQEEIHFDSRSIYIANPGSSTKNVRWLKTPLSAKFRENDWGGSKPGTPRAL